MLNDVSYKFDLWRLQRKKERTRKSYKKFLEVAKKEKKSHEDLQEISTEEMHFIGLIDDDIAQLYHRYIVGQAEKYLMPSPSYITRDGTWEQSNITGRWRLASPALTKMRTAIRKEQKNRRERWQGWLVVLAGIIGASTGFIGALIGLISVWNSN